MPEPSENGLDAVDILEKEMMSFCNLIPVSCWGFDDDVKESLKMRKHSLVNRQLSKKERKSMSAQQKQHLAKGLGLVPNTVQEVLEWMSNSKQHSKVQPQKVVAPVKRAAEPKKEKVEQKKVQKETKKVDSDSEEESSDDEEENDSDDEVEEPAAKKQKKEESSDEEEEEDDGEAGKKNGDVEEEEEDDDSTDEEKDEVPAKKIKLVAPSVLKSNDKIDKEIQKLEEDEDNESPEIKRQIALLRLQKKLKEMKTDRKGKGPAKVTPAMAAKLAEEKRLKRRESKLKLKQRRAEEKKNKADATNVKQEAAENGSNGTEEAAEKKKSGISFNNLKFEIKEDKQRGKKQRTAKKDRALKLTGRDYKSLIAKVEETKATIAKVREADPHKATIMEDELKWEKTLKRAAGGKVKDNLEMLKKALAKKNKLKEKKKEKWENRDKKVVGEKETVSFQQCSSFSVRVFFW
ncbi:hypothetical protein CAEBREN_11730 [Caenorhabditis brenneri]|uniref:Ribosomal RNA-processing protein 14/surfeit locus protein 6 C-terminal domain-containing protein n=1 Tax=Caenorhabditis brenneri TaxID=135651 RepID=G0MPX2_CAEBE|nr:hypothetical protein CAEBREN_11730 [Caenorhabditis brenneri]